MGGGAADAPITFGRAREIVTQPDVAAARQVVDPVKRATSLDEQIAALEELNRGTSGKAMTMGERIRNRQAIARLQAEKSAAEKNAEDTERERKEFAEAQAEDLERYDLSHTLSDLWDSQAREALGIGPDDDLPLPAARAVQESVTAFRAGLPREEARMSFNKMLEDAVESSEPEPTPEELRAAAIQKGELGGLEIRARDETSGAAEERATRESEAQALARSRWSEKARTDASEAARSALTALQRAENAERAKDPEEADPSAPKRAFEAALAGYSEEALAPALSDPSLSPDVKKMLERYLTTRFGMSGDDEERASIRKVEAKIGRALTPEEVEDFKARRRDA